ncbi:MAG: DUF4397 domain-containing protein [Nitriliruptoraceae bacterium]
MKKKLYAAIAAAALAVIPATAALADGHLGSLSVITETVSTGTEGVEVVAVHGVPPETFASLGVDSTAVDIYVNGDLLLDGVEFGDSAVTSDLPNADYTVDIRVAGAEADSDPLLTLGPAPLADGSFSVVAHLDTDGAPVLNAYGNTTDEGAGIQPFHTANFGAVDILAGGAAALEGVENGDTAFIATGAVTVEGVGIAVAGESEAALSLGDVAVPEDTVVLAYAVGQLPVADDDAADVEADDEADEEMEQPTEVDSGTGGLLDAGLPMWVAALMVLGALGIAAPAVAASRRS